MNYFLAIFIGFVQGVTEFLPISSTGHLVIFENLFGISQKTFGLAFDASLHLGTLLAVLIFFHKDYLKLINLKDNRLLLNLIIGTGPAVILGLVFEKVIESILRQLWIIGLAFILFSAVFILAEVYSRRLKSKEEISKIGALVIGIFQAIALIPGVSRSGSTISAGLFLGLSRVQAARFAFMLSGPIVAGAGLKKLIEVLTIGDLAKSEINFFIIGICSSAIFGYLTIKYFLKYLSARTLYPFVVYRVILGLFLLYNYFYG